MIMKKRILLRFMSLFNKPSNTYKTGDATAYLYGSLENDIYMKTTKQFKVPEAQILNKYIR